MPTPPSAALADLAAAYGIATHFWDWQGRHTQVSAETIRSVLAAMDVTADTDEQAAHALAQRHLAPWRRTLSPTLVIRQGWTPWVPVHVPDGAGVRLAVVLEDGGRVDAEQVDHWVPPREVDGVLVGEATFVLPGDLPLGWHQLVADVEGAAEPASATLVVTPAWLGVPDRVRQPATGMMTQLYQVRSAHSWGIGDFGDLEALASWTARDLGGQFVLVNPVHAAEPVVPIEPSPYLPSSRRFRNPLYLSVPAIPEVDRLSAADRDRLDAWSAAGRALNTAETLDRDGAWALKLAALRLLYAVGRSEEREAAFAAYRAREGQGLVDFATWCALATVHGLPSSTWPDEVAGPGAEGIAAFREEHADEVEFHAWLQWLLEVQLDQVQESALAAGMDIGVIHDLAVGVHPLGADAWALGHALALGVTVGAPPDQFNQLGQNWSQPPWRPDRLADLGFAPFRDMVRTVLRSSGGVRVDHIIGLFRLWWIPEGASPAEGTYVAYDHEALVGILCLEAHRAGAVVIGEDLGVVEPSTRDYLRERGVLGTSVLWFEWEHDRPLPPEHYREYAMSTVTTHDLPPTAGYLLLEHVAIRERLHLLSRPVEEEIAAESRAIDAVRGALVERGLITWESTVEDVVVALHTWVAQTPSVLIAVSLADLVGDRRAINQPGTHREYPNWSLPLTDSDGMIVGIEDLKRASLAGRIAEAVQRRG